MNFSINPRSKAAFTTSDTSWREEPSIPESYHLLTVRGVTVSFPYSPYNVQEIFMAKMIEALQNGQNALLESPTGTGKTLCILCAALAWQQSYTTASQTLRSMRDKREIMVAPGSVVKPITMGPAVAPIFAAAGLVIVPQAAPSTDIGSVLNKIDMKSYTYADAKPGVMGGMALPSVPTNPLAIGGIGGAAVQDHQRGEFRPKIIYASRTHSQLSQVIRELKRSSYTPKIAVLGSREQLCVHHTVSKQRGNAQTYSCRALTKTRKCGYKLELETQMMTPNATNALFQGASSDILDIEELAAAGKRNKFCPYYFSREKQTQQDADIILLPYNYLVDFTTRAQALEFVDLKNSVVIFDEAHNIEQFASEAASLDLTAADLARCMDELRAAVEPFHKSAMASAAISKVGAGSFDESGASTVEMAAANFDPRDALQLRLLMLNLEKWLDAVDLATGMSKADTPGTSPPACKVSTVTVDGAPALVADGSYMYEVLQKFQISFSTKDAFVDLIDKVVAFLSTREAVAGSATSGSRSSFALESFKAILQRVFKDLSSAEAMKRHYRVVIHTPPPDYRASDAKIAARGRTLSYWCMSPGVAMQELVSLGVRSVILASGTLSPMDSYASELQLSFPIRLENPHVIDTDQVLVGICKKSPGGYVLNSSFEHRNRDEYKRELGNTISSLVRTVPDGVLVFFPSYSSLNEAITFWKTDKGGEVWRRISGTKTAVIVEARKQDEFLKQITDFNEAVDGRGGALLFAVCRGKVSEGIDFADARGRAVLITGIPYPPHKDAKVILKRSYLDDTRKADSSRLSGGAWYHLQAFRTINQAIGRVIRHKNDYGAILLLDERFDRERDGISAWLRPRIQLFDQSTSAMDRLALFFRNSEGKAKQQSSRQMASARPLAQPSVLSGAAPAPTLARHAVVPLEEELDPTTRMLRALQARKAEAATLSAENAARAIEARVSAPVRPSGMPFIPPASSRPSISSLIKARDDAGKLGTPSFGIGSAAAKATQPVVQPEIPSPAPAATNDQSSDKVERAKKYMSSLKGVLSTEAFDSFRDSLRQFRGASASASEADVKNLLRKIADIISPFVARHELHSFLEGFSAFVPAHFMEVLEKQISREVDRCKPNIMMTGQSSRGIVDLVTGPAVAKSTPAMFQPKPRVEPTGVVSSAIASQSISAHSKSHVGSMSTANAEMSLFPVSTHVSGVKRSRDEETPFSDSATSSGLKCAVCLDTGKDMMASGVCGHILCETCWDSTLEVKLECPLCRKFVRKKQLIKLHTND